MQQDSSGQSKVKRIVTGVTFGILGVAIFLFGVGVGSDRLQFNWFEREDRTGLPEQLDFSSVEQLYDALRKNYDGELDANELLDGILHGLANATGDPYTVYLNAEEAQEFKDQLNGTFSGIGAELGLDDDDNLIIVSPIEGFPAAQAGLRPQDRIVGIDGESAGGLSIFEAVNKIRGPKGTDVTLDILRGDQDLSFTITREDITIPSAEWEVLDGNIGYLQITQFGEDTARLAEQAAREFEDRGVAGVILDLRGNPGGLLDQAIKVASMWLPRGETILEQKRGGLTTSTESAVGGDSLRGKPTVVLINEGSASGAEIVAGALKDNDAATVIGVKSFGKGSVQEIVPLRDGAELKVTVARWYRPSGENIDKKGVSPDREVKMTEEDYDRDRDPQKNAALDFLR